MIKRIVGGGLAAVLGLFAFSPAVAQAQVTQRAPAGVHVINLHAAYESAVAHHVRSGKPSGIIYTAGHHAKAATGPAGCAEPDCPLVYHGGPVEHTAHIYLLLWGPNWSSTSEQATAAYMQAFYQSLGVQPSDTWSTITSQYPDSTGGFPMFNGSEFMGTFNDTSTPPTGTTTGQFAAEASAFASTHNLTTNPQDDQVVIATQSGTCPSGFAGTNCGANAGNYCAYHSNVTGGVTFTNLPYLLDAGPSCGEDIIPNGTRGTYDGFSIVGGHEYAETVTDPYPLSGWIDTADPGGGEIGDKCAWVYPGTNTIDIHLVNLANGAFAMQPLFSNANLAAGGQSCPMAASPDTLTVANPGSQTSTVGTAVSLQIHATSSAGAKLHFLAAGLPGGLSINSTTGMITGTPATAGVATSNVTVDDTTGAISSVSFTWTVKAAQDTVTVTSPGNQTSTVGTAVSLQIQATSSSGATLTYTASGLPAGLSINSTTGKITGTPTTVGTGTTKVTVTDTTGASGTASFTWTVKTAQDTVTVTNPGNQTSTVRSYTHLLIHATSSTGATLTFRAAGVPTGMFINSHTGRIRGTPRRTGRYSVTVTATDTTGASGTASFTWTIKRAGKRIRGRHDVCVTDYHSHRGNGTKIVIWHCNHTHKELWSHGPNHSLRIYGKCLTDPNFGMWNTGLVLSTCTGKANQHWAHRHNGEWVVHVHGRNLCLTVPRDPFNPYYSTRNGIPLRLLSCHDHVNQRWRWSA